MSRSPSVGNIVSNFRQDWMKTMAGIGYLWKWDWCTWSNISWEFNSRVVMWYLTDLLQNALLICLLFNNSPKQSESVIQTWNYDRFKNNIKIYIRKSLFTKKFHLIHPFRTLGKYKVNVFKWKLSLKYRPTSSNLAIFYLFNIIKREWQYI